MKNGSYCHGVLSLFVFDFFFLFFFFFLGGGFGLELASACIYFGHGEHVFHGVKVFPSMIGLRSCKKFHIFMGAV